MERKANGGPRPAPRVDYDVITGLPNHRATPERSAQILMELAAKNQAAAVDSNNTPWHGPQAGCWDSADRLVLFPEPNTLL